MPTINIAPKIVRSGTYEATYKVPKNITGNITVQVSADPVDLEDESKRLDFQLFRSDDGVNWPSGPFIAIGYEGGIHYKPVLGEVVRYAAEPGFVFDSVHVKDKYIKLRAILTGTWNAGLKVIV